MHCLATSHRNLTPLRCRHYVFHRLFSELQRRYPIKRQKYVFTAQPTCLVWSLPITTPTGDIIAVVQSFSACWCRRSHGMAKYTLLSRFQGVVAYSLRWLISHPMHAQSSILCPTSPTPHTNLATKRLTSYPPDIKSPITYSDLGEGEPHGRANYPLCRRTQPSRIRNSAVNAPRSRITSNSPTDP